MTDHVQIIRLALTTWASTETRRDALAALDVLEAALQDAVEVAEEAVADADRKTEALRKIANGEAALRQEAVARAALGEDE